MLAKPVEATRRKVPQKQTADDPLAGSGKGEKVR